MDEEDKLSHEALAKHFSLREELVVLILRTLVDSYRFELDDPNRKACLVFLKFLVPCANEYFQATTPSRFDGSITYVIKFFKEVFNVGMWKYDNGQDIIGNVQGYGRAKLTHRDIDRDEARDMILDKMDAFIDEVIVRIWRTKDYPADYFRHQFASVHHDEEYRLLWNEVERWINPETDIGVSRSNKTYPDEMQDTRPSIASRMASVMSRVRSAMSRPAESKESYPTVSARSPGPRRRSVRPQLE